MSETLFRSKMIRGMPIFTLGLAVVALLLCSCVEKPVLREGGVYSQIRRPVVTVKLLETKESLSICSSGPFVIRCFPSEGEPSTYYASARILLKLSGGGIALSQKTQGELEAELKEILLLPSEESSAIYLNDKPYRGALEISRREKPCSLLALNIVHLEDYLKGVIPAEMGKLRGQEVEALKAQAVAARTYSLSRLGQFAERGYDLEATVADQIYQGIQGEDPEGNRAVELTRGEVLTHKGKLVCAYYHANSGGKTESVERVWDRPKEDYLIPTDDRNFCSWAENYAWEESWTKETLEGNLQKFLAASVSFPSGEFGDLVNLKIRRRSESGRVEALDAVTDWGTYRICGDKIRWALRRGSNRNSILPSTCFDLEIERDSDGSIQGVIARGRGNGHGVGMCQTGAIGMARKGYSYEDILAYYYSGARLTTCYGQNGPATEKLAGSGSPSSCLP